MRVSNLKKLYTNVYYGTIIQIVSDLAQQVTDLESCIELEDYCYGKKEDKRKIKSLLSLAKDGIFHYFGEGGIPLKGHRLESFVNKHYPNMEFYKSR